MRSSTGLPRSPACDRPNANSTDTNSTCSRSPLTNAEKKAGRHDVQQKFAHALVLRGGRIAADRSRIE